MESDDDFYSSTPLEESSSPVQPRKLKRLKKTRVSNEPKVKSVDVLLSLAPVDFAKIVELESSKIRSIDDLSEELHSQSPSEYFDDENLRVDSAFGECRRETRRGLDFGDESEEKGAGRSHEMEEDKAVTETDGIGELSGEDPSAKVDEDAMELRSNISDDKLTTEAALQDEFGGNVVHPSDGTEEDLMDLNTDKSDKKRSNEGELNEKKEKKKRREKSEQDDSKPKASSSNKKKEEKERKATLQQLHAESQRLLRETRDAAFKPIPVAQKPIYSILEKIRKRKLELSIKATLLNHSASTAESSDSASKLVETSGMSKSVSIEEKPAERIAKVIEVEMDDERKHLSNDLQTSHEDVSKECGTQSTFQKDPSLFEMDEETTPPFRAPLDDTQDLPADTQTSDSKDELPSDQQNNPTEEVMAPSLLALNLKFDSAPIEDDISSDEEDQNKENIEPHPHRAEEPVSPKGDPVKAFVDDEAVEEDDSDNELFHFKENEEDEDEDFEELKDMIATDYKENPVDNDKRNELHQKWLEQQDAAGTDNLLQRLNYGSKFTDGSLINEESDEEEEEEEFYNEGDEHAVVPRKVGKMNSRRAKEMIADMFPVADDAFLSDDEETEKKIVQQRLLERVEEKVTLVSPAEDENSREVFGLIKKLNIASDTKKKPKASSFFDTMLTGGNSNSSSRSSFLGRASSHLLPSSQKKGSSAPRSYIFGRDDSNSRSSISITEDSSQIEKMLIPTESQPTRSTTKFTSSQAKISSQKKKNSTTEAAKPKGTSLFEILKRSSSGQSDFCKQDNNNMVGLTQFSAFKLPKKPVKMQV